MIHTNVARQYETPSEAVLMTSKDLLALGTRSAPRDQAIHEILNYTLTIREPWWLPVAVEGRDREYRHVIGILEALQLVGQTATPDVMFDHVKTFRNYENSGYLHGAYGARVAGRFDDLVRLFRRDPDTRQAVLTIYDSATDLDRDKRDIPCTLSIQFLLRENRLHARTSMRSNDVYLGLPYDLTQFIALQGAVAAHLDVPVGSYTHTVGSMHLYDRDVDKAISLTRDEPADIGQEPVLWPDKRLGNISARARDLLHQPAGFAPATWFEKWARDELVWGSPAREVNE